MLTKEQIDEKIVVLYEFLILRRVLGGAKIEGKRRAFKRDPKEKRVRRILETAQNENQLDIMCHDLVTGKITLDAWLARKENAAV
jgi:hypothetical protein